MKPANDNALAYTIRDAVPDDVAFVQQTWARSHRASRYAYTLGLDRYHDRHLGRIKLLMQRCPVLVAEYGEDDAGLILGWACGQPPDVLHYAYVRGGYRGAGIGTALTSGLRERFGALRVHSHETVGSRSWVHKQQLAHDPMSVMEGG